MDGEESSGAAASLVGRLMAAKKGSGKTYGQIAVETGLTNVYVAQLLRRQAQLKPATAPALRAALPALTDDLLTEMMTPPFRTHRPDLLNEPTVCRVHWRHTWLHHEGDGLGEYIPWIKGALTRYQTGW